MVVSATKVATLFILKSRPDILNNPAGDFISHEDYLLNLVQNIVFFCTKEYIVLYKRLHSFVQEYRNTSKRILKRWGMFAKRPGWMKKNKTGSGK